MDASAIQKLADSLGMAVDSIWQMKPAIVQQHIYSSIASIIIGLILVVVTFFIVHKYCDCDCDSFIDDTFDLIVAIFCAIIIVAGFVLVMYGTIFFANWTTAPDVSFIRYIVSLVK